MRQYYVGVCMKHKKFREFCSERKRERERLGKENFAVFVRAKFPTKTVSEKFLKYSDEKNL